VSVKTNERPGTRAVLRHCRMSSYKVREVLDLVRGVEYSRAVELLDHVDRAAGPIVAKLVRSAAANAEHNEGLDPEEMYIVSAFADEGTTLKRWRPRARGRATRIRKRTCHITVVLARMPDDKLARRRARVAAEATERRARRVAGTRRQARVAGARGASSPSDARPASAAEDAGLAEAPSWEPAAEGVAAVESEAAEVERIDAGETGSAPAEGASAPSEDDAATDAGATDADAPREDAD